MIRLLFDVTSITNDITGVSRVGLELLKELVKLKDIKIHLIINSHLTPENELTNIIKKNNLSFDVLEVAGIGPSREFKFLYYSIKKRGTYDVFHSITSNAPLAFFSKGVATFHDLKYILFPHYMGQLSFFKSNFIRLQFGLICMLYKKITCSSQSTLNDLNRVFPFLKKQIKNKASVVYLGLTPLEEIRPFEKPPGTNKYFAYVGELRPHKNIYNMVRAFELFSERYNLDVDFVIGGNPHKTFDVVSLNPKVKFIGRVPDDELASLYKQSLGLFFASRYEGFGLPILEAMHLGVPVITSNISSMPEVAGEAGLVIDPDNLGQMSDALYILSTDEECRKALSDKSNVQTKKFSWEKCAFELMDKYKNAK